MAREGFIYSHDEYSAATARGKGGNNTHSLHFEPIFNVDQRIFGKRNE